MCHKQSKTLAALKQVHFTTEDDLDDYSIEISILSECHHKNVVALLESFIYDSKLWVRMSLFCVVLVFIHCLISTVCLCVNKV